jgi:hypothetical protein
VKIKADATQHCHLAALDMSDGPESADRVTAHDGSAPPFIDPPGDLLQSSLGWLDE